MEISPLLNLPLSPNDRGRRRPEEKCASRSGRRKYFGGYFEKHFPLRLYPCLEGTSYFSAQGSDRDPNLREDFYNVADRADVVKTAPSRNHGWCIALPRHAARRWIGVKGGFRWRGTMVRVTGSFRVFQTQQVHMAVRHQAYGISCPIIRKFAGISDHAFGTAWEARGGPIFEMQYLARTIPLDSGHGRDRLVLTWEIWVKA